MNPVSRSTSASMKGKVFDMSDVRPKISSLAAPTEADLAVLRAMSDEDRRELLEEELAKGFDGPWTTMDENLREELWRRAVERAAAKRNGSEA